MSEKIEIQLLELKKKEFIDVVSRICENRNLPRPYVNFDGCPAENADQLAHYHPDVNMICISKRQLTVLNFDDINEVVAHEVAHILELNHGDKFDKEYVKNKICGWEPPAGVVVIYGNQKVEPVSKEARDKIEKTFKRLQKEEEWKRMAEERKRYPLMPESDAEYSIEAFSIESGKREYSNKKRISEKEAIEFISVSLGGKEIKFKVPIEIIPLPVRSVTRQSNLGIDVEYIIKNEDLGIKVKASNEMRGVRYFREEFRKLCYWCMLDEERNIPVHKIIQRRYLESFIEEIRRDIPLASQKRSEVFIIKESPEDLDVDKAQIKREIVGKGEKEKEESQQERIKRTREELEAKLEETTYNDIQNVNSTNIPKEELMPEDLSPDNVIKEANELRKLYSPKLRFRLLRGIKEIKDKFTRK